jgi:hypothetical protein
VSLGARGLASWYRIDLSHPRRGLSLRPVGAVVLIDSRPNQGVILIGSCAEH